ncbi:MAG: hypothetical protein H6Q39_1925 [Chloroflexi bacterium]|nr:hypothetical protein [Chloroflexota bacterium]
MEQARQRLMQNRILHSLSLQPEVSENALPDLEAAVQHWQNTIAEWENRIRIAGGGVLPEAEVGRIMNNKIDLIEHYINNWCGGDYTQLNRFMTGTEFDGGIGAAIADDYYVMKAREFSTSPAGKEYLRTHMSPPRELRRQWAVEGENQGTQTVNQFMNQH